MMAKTTAQIMSDINGMDDTCVWELAVMSVGVASMRAAEVKNSDVHKLCLKFIAQMHIMVDTPELPVVESRLQ